MSSGIASSVGIDVSKGKSTIYILRPNEDYVLSMTVTAIIMIVVSADDCSRASKKDSCPRDKLCHMKRKDNIMAL